MKQVSALLLSIAIEAAVAAAAVRVLRWGKSSRAALAAALGTLLTHWVAWQVVPTAMNTIGNTPGFLAVELVVTAVEAAVYFAVVPLSAGRAIVISLIANGSSAVAGVILTALNLFAAQ